MHALLLSPHNPALGVLVKTLASYIKSTDYGLDVTPEYEPLHGMCPSPSAATVSDGSLNDGEGSAAADMMEVDGAPPHHAPPSLVAWKEVRPGESVFLVVPQSDYDMGRSTQARI
jgi:hypothetical protein